MAGVDSRRQGGKCSAAWWSFSFLFLLTTCTASARAEAKDWSLRGSGALALMVSADQIEKLHYDSMGIVGSLLAEYAVHRAIELRTGALGGGFLSSDKPTGGLMALLVGALFGVPLRRMRPYAAFDMGVGLTDTLVRPYFQIGVGIDVRVAIRIEIGPVFGYGCLVQRAGPEYSSNAGFFTGGVAMRYRFGEEAPRVEPKPRRPVMPLPPPRRPPPEPTPPVNDAEVLELLERALPAPTQRVELLAPVLFAFDSTELEPLGVAMLHEVVHTLRTRPDIELVRVEGYADARGGADYNRDLSRRRAERVQAFLIERGIDPARLTVAGEGAEHFLEHGSEEASHLQNRRVVFRVLRVKTP